MLDTSRRALIANAALCFAACPDVGSSAIGRETSPRIMRLRSIFGRIVEINHALGTNPGAPARIAKRLRHELRLLAAEVVSIGERVWQTPIQGPIDVLERALVTYHADGAHQYAA